MCEFPLWQPGDALASAATVRLRYIDNGPSRALKLNAAVAADAEEPA